MVQYRGPGPLTVVDGGLVDPLPVSLCQALGARIG